MKVTDGHIVLCLKQLGKSADAKTIAECLGTDSRAVATASRKAVKDGRIKRSYRRANKGEQVRGFYRYVRSNPLHRMR